MSFKSGFISVMGTTNVGKSTLVNKMVGEKVSIVSPKAQTTRSTVRGVLTTDAFQMVFLDTPGLITPRNKLNESMMKTAHDAMREVDAILYVVDAPTGLRLRERELLKKFMGVGVPLYVDINKIDVPNSAMLEETVGAIRDEGFEGPVYKTCALSGMGVPDLIRGLSKGLPEGPKYYPDDMYTDASMRFMAGEIIREKALNNLSDEVPHGVGVEIEKCEERADKKIIDISAAIYCEKKSHKSIIVGNRGGMVKKIGSEARPDLEELFGMQVYLELFVKVRENWRNSITVLKTLGYDD